MSDNSDSIFREVDEEVRRDQLMALWKRYGASFVGATVLVIAVVVGWQLWTSWQESILRDNADAYAALDNKAGGLAPAEAAAVYTEGAAGFEGNYRALVSLKAAGAYMNAGNYADAIDSYLLVAQTIEDRRIEDFALYMAASAEAAADKDDDAIARLQTLSAPERPLRYNAMELLAAIYAAKGDTETARAQFLAILEDPAAPGGVKSRAQDMIALFDQQVAENAVKTDADMAGDQTGEEGVQQ